MLSRLARVLALFFVAHGFAHAQCQLQQDGAPQPHLSGFGYCSTMWDPDGAGPLPQRLVVGGSTLLGGSQLLGGTVPSMQRVFTWDGATWEPLGSGPGDNLSGSVSALVSWNGELIAGGNFTTAGGPNHIARWDGTSWQSLGSGSPNSVRKLANWNGNLVAAGHVGTGTATTPVLAQWNGTMWTSLPAPPALDEPTAIVAFEGELIVAGWEHLPLVTQGVLERWNGSSWATTIAVGGGIAAMAVRPSVAFGGSDTLIVGGGFTNIGGTAIDHVAKSNGAPSFAWSSVGGGLPDTCVTLLVQNTGVLDYTVVARTTTRRRRSCGTRPPAERGHRSADSRSTRSSRIPAHTTA